MGPAARELTGLELDSRSIRTSLEAVGVAPRDMSLVIYPFQALYLYQEQHQPVRILKSFDVLAEPGRVPPQPAQGLEDVLSHIH